MGQELLLQNHAALELSHHPQEDIDAIFSGKECISRNQNLTQ